MTKMFAQQEYTREELLAKIAQMQAASDAFYRAAVQIGNHPFIEFTGLMNEYILLCKKAVEDGVDFTQCSVHSGRTLPTQPYHLAYIAEKLECIFTHDIHVGSVSCEYIHD